MKKKAIGKLTPDGPFAKDFLMEIDKIEADAKAIGINLTVLCKKAKISRTVPVRWRRKIPLTIELLDKMRGIVDKMTAQHNLKTTTK